MVNLFDPRNFVIVGSRLRDSDSMTTTTNVTLRRLWFNVIILLLKSTINRVSIRHKSYNDSELRYEHVNFIDGYEKCVYRKFTHTRGVGPDDQTHTHTHTEEKTARTASQLSEAKKSVGQDDREGRYHRVANYLPPPHSDGSLLDVAMARSHPSSNKRSNLCFMHFRFANVQIKFKRTI